MLATSVSTSIGGHCIRGGCSPDTATRENELHRVRHAELYYWWHDMPGSPALIKAMHWLRECAGAREPHHGDTQGSNPARLRP
jgi:hypothetical protein